MSDSTVATTILAQLGGNRFAAMTGAKDFLYSGNSLQFRLPARMAKSGITSVRVQLDANDTYTVAFFAVRGLKIRMVSTHADVYADSLRRLFESETGLLTSLSGAA